MDPDWDDFPTRPSWYHNMDSVVQAGVCVRSKQLDFDEETAFAARQKLFDIARDDDIRPSCMVVSLTHPHDPFAVPEQYWSRYTDAEIDMPHVPAVASDPHSARLRHVCAMDEQPVTDAHIRAARRAYYGAMSYVDDHVGRLMDTLAQVGMADDTVVILLSDHGELLGEHGLWFKMSFLEGACRIPLIVHAPGRFASGTVDACVSLVDILPTLAELAGDGQAPEYATPLNGRSLLPHLERSGEHDEVVGEYLAEGVVAPLVMLRRGVWKYIHSDGDPDQLFDLSRDPDERHNLTTAPELASFRAEAARRWEFAALRAAVVASQRRRRLVAGALRTGTLAGWDFQPRRDAGQRYVRSHMALDDIEARARLPRVG